jgi:hypothetical protein
VSLSREGEAAKYSAILRPNAQVELAATTPASPSSCAPLLYLRDFGIARRGYQQPARFLSFYTRQDAGQWRHGRAVTVSVEMRKSTSSSGSELRPVGASTRCAGRCPRLGGQA